MYCYKYYNIVIYIILLIVYYITISVLYQYIELFILNKTE